MLPPLSYSVVKADCYSRVRYSYWWRPLQAVPRRHASCPGVKLALSFDVGNRCLAFNDCDGRAVHFSVQSHTFSIGEHLRFLSLINLIRGFSFLLSPTYARARRFPVDNIFRRGAHFCKVVNLQARRGERSLWNGKRHLWSNITGWLHFGCHGRSLDHELVVRV